MQSPAPSPEPTQKEIARTLGISQSTLSRALADSPKVPQSKREEIQKAARKLGYRPNPSATALIRRRRVSRIPRIEAALAWINSWPDPHALHAWKEFENYWLGARTAAEKFGYHLEEFVCNEQVSVTRLEKILHARGISGILLPPTPTPWHGLDWGDFSWEGFSLVRLGRRLDKPAAHFVTSDQAGNAMLAFDKMREKGYERPGFVGSPDATKHFGAGFLWAQQKLPEPCRLPPLLFYESNSMRNQKVFAAWLKKTKPDAILTSNAALPAMLAKAEYRVPADIGLATTSVLDTSIDAGILQNSFQIGREAALKLISLINANERGIPESPHATLVTGAWREGATLPSRLAQDP